jgi:hypothetical protein
MFALIQRSLRRLRARRLPVVTGLERFVVVLASPPLDDGFNCLPSSVGSRLGGADMKALKLSSLSVTTADCCYHLSEVGTDIDVLKAYMLLLQVCGVTSIPGRRDARYAGRLSR